MVWTNDFGYSYGAGQAPWGGLKESGFGARTRSTGSTSCSQREVRRLGQRARAGAVVVPVRRRARSTGSRACSSVLHGEATACAARVAHRRGLAHLAKRYLRR